MLSYTKQYLDHEARAVATEIRKETRKSAKMKSWQIIINSNGQDVSLEVVVQAYDGLRQRNRAI